MTSSTALLGLVPVTSSKFILDLFLYFPAEHSFWRTHVYFHAVLTSSQSSLSARWNVNPSKLKLTGALLRPDCGRWSGLAKPLQGDFHKYWFSSRMSRVCQQDHTHTHAHTIKYANPLVLNFDTMPLVSRKRARCEVRSGRFLFCFYLEANPINWISLAQRVRYQGPDTHLALTGRT